jgi:uncharacterized membrane protein YhdT
VDLHGRAPLSGEAPGPVGQRLRIELADLFISCLFAQLVFHAVRSVLCDFDF